MPDFFKVHSQSMTDMLLFLLHIRCQVKPYDHTELSTGNFFCSHLCIFNNKCSGMYILHPFFVGNLI